ncbi:MAG: lytic transglycosylase domain-containing protein [Thermoleophilia bacterium]
MKLVIRLALVAIVLAALAGVVSGIVAPETFAPLTPAWVARTVYPLEHENTIRAAAAKNHVDPALVAAMIFVESGFDEDARSSQGAVGLMQVLPDTAKQIAHETGGSDFEVADLQDPNVNVRYGTYYLRRTLDQFDGDTVSAVAAYNAGEGVVQTWAAAAAAQGRSLRTTDIAYPETRAYVDDVLQARKIYRETYARELLGAD